MRIGLIGAVIGVAGSLAMAGGNAALEYYRAWNLMERDLHLGLLSDEDEFRVSEDGAMRLVEAQGTVEQLLEASRGGDADWGIAYEDGPLALLPHLGLMRASARVIGADALRRLDDGDHAGAVQRIAALYRMGDDVSDDRILISSLVGMAIGNEANKLAGRCLELGVLDSGDARALLEAIGEAGREDRFGLRASILGEWRIIGEFVLSRAPEEVAGAWLLETLQMEADDEVTRGIAAMDKRALMGEMGGWTVYFGDLLSAWDSGERERIDAVVERLKEREYGDLAYVIAPAVTRAFESNRQSGEEFDRLVERLEEIAD